MNLVLLPRKITPADSVIRTGDDGLPRMSTGSASSNEFNEATYRSTLMDFNEITGDNRG